MNDHVDADDELPTHLKDAARAYNDPPVRVPRDEMWAAIEKARENARVTPIHSARRPWSARPLTWAAAAAVLLAVGYAAGRFGVNTEPQQPTVAAAPVPRAPSRADAIVAVDHFARAEVFLTGLTRDPATAVNDTALARWSRTLLRDTRLLMDSPAAANASRRALLEDLERILVQISRGLGARDAEDLAFTSHTVRTSTLLNQLRTSVPAGAAPRSEE
ncbi:MAG TPA: hypothetical protein VJR92_08400 [Gemmatimonadaceae bacterium]|nr:hypothetical protein [Gemmatimonadaceae bacterium]